MLEGFDLCKTTVNYGSFLNFNAACFDGPEYKLLFGSCVKWNGCYWNDIESSC